jgi:hypothetical protein
VYEYINGDFIPRDIPNPDLENQLSILEPRNRIVHVINSDLDTYPQTIMDDNNNQIVLLNPVFRWRYQAMVPKTTYLPYPLVLELHRQADHRICKMLKERYRQMLGGDENIAKEKSGFMRHFYGGIMKFVPREVYISLRNSFRIWDIELNDKITTLLI